mmetsp:Transcript_21511/g.32008  ORF Transcript_21511/g.32008 Transcript_21511/m.32008 type:complete len:261 (+) Transcript_21511:1388-2170(+)
MLSSSPLLKTLRSHFPPKRDVNFDAVRTHLRFAVFITCFKFLLPWVQFIITGVFPAIIRLNAMIAHPLAAGSIRPTFSPSNKSGFPRMKSARRVTATLKRLYFIPPVESSPQAICLSILNAFFQKTTGTRKGWPFTSSGATGAGRFLASNHPFGVLGIFRSLFDSSTRLTNMDHATCATVFKSVISMSSQLYSSSIHPTSIGTVNEVIFRSFVKLDPRRISFFGIPEIFRSCFFTLSIISLGILSISMSSPALNIFPNLF